MEQEPGLERSRTLEHARQTLQQLREEVGAAPDLDPARRQHMLNEVAEIETLLGRPEQTDAPEGGAERFEQLAMEFEVSHPVAAELLGRLANLLSSMGI